jgi:hypothetical protein
MLKVKRPVGVAGLMLSWRLMNFTPPAFEVCYQVAQIPQGSTQPVQFPNHHRISGTELAQHLFQFRPVFGLPDFLFLKDELTALPGQLISLQFQLLVLSAYPGVTYFHFCLMNAVSKTQKCILLRPAIACF